MEATITLELTREESELIHKALWFYAGFYTRKQPDGTFIERVDENGNKPAPEAFRISSDIIHLWKEKDALKEDKQ